MKKFLFLVCGLVLLCGCHTRVFIDEPRPPVIIDRADHYVPPPRHHAPPPPPPRHYERHVSVGVRV